MLHGRDRVEPYAWIADPDDALVRGHLEAERAYYDARVAGLAEDRAVLAAEMHRRLPAVEPSAPWEAGGWAYRHVTPEGSEYERLVRRPVDERDAEEVVLLDLQVVHDDGGTGYARDGLLEVSPDGRWLAWSVDLDGDEVYTLHFRDLTTGADLDDVVEHTYYGGAWSTDSSAFLYVVHDVTYRPYRVWRHVLGTPVTDDVLVLEDFDERLEIEMHASRSGLYAVISLRGRGFREDHLLRLDVADAVPCLVRARELGVEYELEHAPGLGPDGSDGFLVVTNLGAPEFRVMWAEASDPTVWEPLIHEDPAVRVWGADAFAGGFVLTVRRDGVQSLRLHPVGGAAYDVLPGDAGGMVQVGRNDDFDVAAVTVVVDSFIRPTVWWDVAWDGLRAQRHVRETVGVDPEDYVTERRLAPSDDGVLVPVILVRHRETPLDGTAPCLLYGYGSYEVCLDPDWDFERTLPSLLDRGVVYALGHPRGGGEMGRRWWEDGHLAAKQNTFTDHGAVAAYLLDGVVSSVVTRGLSAGGLLQGAMYAQFPRLFAGIVAEVPFVDAVTTMLDPSLPLTAQEWLEWGDPRDPVEYGWIAAYTPMENLPEVADRPPLMVTGAVHDPRVLVREPARWVARLRASDPAAGAGDDPSSPTSPRTVIFRPETAAGAHGGPSGRYAELDYEAEVFAWVLACLRVPV